MRFCRKMVEKIISDFVEIGIYNTLTSHLPTAHLPHIFLPHAPPMHKFLSTVPPTSCSPSHLLLPRRQQSLTYISGVPAPPSHLHTYLIQSALLLSVHLDGGARLGPVVVHRLL